MSLRSYFATRVPRPRSALVFSAPRAKRARLDGAALASAIAIVVLGSRRLEGLRPRAPLLVDGEELLDLLLRRVQALLRQARELHPLLEEAQRLLERQVAALEGLHDLGEPLHRVL